MFKAGIPASVHWKVITEVQRSKKYAKILKKRVAHKLKAEILHAFGATRQPPKSSV